MAADRRDAPEAAADRRCAVEGCEARSYVSPNGWTFRLCPVHRASERRNDATEAAWRADIQKLWRDIPRHVCESSGAMWIVHGDPRVPWWRDQHPWARFAGHPPGCPMAPERERR